MTNKQRVDSKAICYICGEPDPDSMDHVPPKFLFSDPKPDNLITLPAHQKCQEYFSLDEEYFSQIILIGSWKNPAANRRVWNEILPRAKDPQKKGFSRMMADSMHSSELRSKAGLIIGHADAVNVTSERIDRVIAKILYGLYYFHFNVRLFDFDIKLTIKSNMNKKSFNKSFLAEYLHNNPNRDFYSRGTNDEFRYSFGSDKTAKEIEFILIFYDRIEFLCKIETIKEAPGENPVSPILNI